MARQHPDVPTAIVERLRLTCLDLPEAREERAWVGIRPTSAIPRYQRAPFFAPPWFPNIVGLYLDAQTNWSEVAELLIASYRVLAPKKLSELLND